MWEIDKEELKFDDPPEIAGQGTFGLVVRAEYRDRGDETGHSTKGAGGLKCECFGALQIDSGLVGGLQI